jgi:hypothetical protein
VTKSGTNEFHGSVYGTYRDGDWFGNNPEGSKFNGFTKEKTYGMTWAARSSRTSCSSSPTTRSSAVRAGRRSLAAPRWAANADYSWLT